MIDLDSAFPELMIYAQANPTVYSPDQHSSCQMFQFIEILELKTSRILILNRLG